MAHTLHRLPTDNLALLRWPPCLPDPLAACHVHPRSSVELGLSNVVMVVPRAELMYLIYFRCVRGGAQAFRGLDHFQDPPFFKVG